MAEVVVLRPGYARTVGGTLPAGGTISLVISEVRMLVDTGGPSERAMLVDTLSRHGLAPEDIGVVVCTHGHTDHIGNLSLFPDASCFLGGDRSHGDEFSVLDFSDGSLAVGSDVRIVPTTGRMMRGCSSAGTRTRNGGAAPPSSQWRTSSCRATAISFRRRAKPLCPKVRSNELF